VAAPSPGTSARHPGFPYRSQNASTLSSLTAVALAPTRFRQPFDCDGGCAAAVPQAARLVMVAMVSCCRVCHRVNGHASIRRLRERDSMRKPERGYPHGLPGTSPARVIQYPGFHDGHFLQPGRYSLVQDYEPCSLSPGHLSLGLLPGERCSENRHVTRRARKTSRAVSATIALVWSTAATGLALLAGPFRPRRYPESTLRRLFAMTPAAQATSSSWCANDTSHSDVLFQTDDPRGRPTTSTAAAALPEQSGAGASLKVSYNPPVCDSRSVFRVRHLANWVFYAEYPMVRWMEQNGTT